MERRFAFTAQFWGNGAVVCRAVEDRPGPVVEQQFGEFRFWTRAQAFATKLNDGLDLTPGEVRQIVTSSLLATARVVQEALHSRSAWERSHVAIAARHAQLRFVLAELALALTFCQCASSLSGLPMLRMFLHADKALHHARQFLTQFDGGDPGELNRIASQTAELAAALRALSPPELI